MKERRGFNPKRRLAAAGFWSPQEREERAEKVAYGGNPEHKRHPADYGLTPPAAPRPGKTLSDARGPLPKARAEAMLEDGIRRGMVSEQMRGRWPQNVWAVSDADEPFEAQLENEAEGVYHGYPMPLADDLRDLVLREWRARAQ